MTTGLKKFSDYNTLLGANLRGDESLLLADTASNGTVTASTISATAATDTISDSGGGLPVVKPGALVLISGFTDTGAELNGLHSVVSSDANNLVTSTDLTVDEAAGASVTVSEVAAMYQLSVDEFAAFIGSASVPNPLVSHTYKDSRHTTVSANVSGSTTRTAANGNVHKLTLTANTTVDVTLGDSETSYMHLIISPGAYTLTLGTSFTKWLGSAPSVIATEHHFLVFSLDGGTTNIAIDLGGAA